MLINIEFEGCTSNENSFTISSLMIGCLQNHVVTYQKHVLHSHCGNLINCVLVLSKTCIAYD